MGLKCVISVGLISGDIASTVVAALAAVMSVGEGVVDSGNQRTLTGGGPFCKFSQHYLQQPSTAVKAKMR
jgi:hypothetical protein